MEMIQAQWPSTVSGSYSLKALEFGLLARSGVCNRPSMSSTLKNIGVNSIADSCNAHCERKKNLCVLILHENWSHKTNSGAALWSVSVINWCMWLDSGNFHWRTDLAKSRVTFPFAMFCSEKNDGLAIGWWQLAISEEVIHPQVSLPLWPSIEPNWRSINHTRTLPSCSLEQRGVEEREKKEEKNQIWQVLCWAC